MISQRNISLVTIKYDESSKLLNEYHFFGPWTRGKSREVKHIVDRIALIEKITAYWQFVDDAIKHGVLDCGDMDQQNAFMDDLQSWGQEIACMLFPRDLHRELWKVAEQSDILLISTNLEEVPWEALFCADAGENGEFLSANCVIQRQLEIEQWEGKAPANLPSVQLVYVDPELVREETKNGHHVLEVLSTGSLTVLKTSSKKALAQAARDASVIHWICEHNLKKGLRLGRNTFYTSRDVAVHRFPSGCVLFMLSCGSGRIQPGGNSFSARIAAASSCTVVAPSSVVAAKEAVRFVIDITSILNDPTVERLSDAWKLLKNPVDVRTADRGITARDCYLLWFGIYGDCNVMLGRTRNDPEDRAA